MISNFHGNYPALSETYMGKTAKKGKPLRRDKYLHTKLNLSPVFNTGPLASGELNIHHGLF